ncbi:type II secretion system F family protein [Phaeobacter sp. 22II1-1F12B]|uniref:type II secretion system F family protein n=1 Tax=Phaeobacter sp. 22II1-1F12B TaxID=1317111 RepID=UPI000B5216DA|nr:type II secretion system F family protein [Phaeobacter sp. 22II1-1F12B]OWU79342.1 pilus assembly protein TadC [Phaeobacter sp. 22II1-1F12B]
MDFLLGINKMLTGTLGPFGPIIAMGGVGIVMILLVVAMMLNQPEDPLKKLKRSMNETDTTKPQKERLRQGARNEQLQKFATFLEPQDVAELSAMQLKLRQAGYQSRDAVRVFHFAQFLLGVIGLILGVVYVTILNADQEFSSQQMVMYIIGPGGVGYYLPKYWVTRRVEERKEAITRGFPDALDMLLVCVEAGQSLDQAIVRVSRELTASYPALAQEFEVVSQEMKAGKDKASVLRDMGERCGVQDVSSFVTVLIQSASFGTSISDALRVFAGEMRDKRVMRAEEAANKLPTKMTLATMGLTVPPLLIILVGPSANGIANLGAMSGN